MAYVIYKSDGSLFLTLEDGQIDTSNTSLSLLGKNVINYGQYENSNYVHLLENFASSSSPSNPIAGQLWFDKTSDILRLKVYSGTTWNSVPNFIFSTSTSQLNPGDFLWKTDTQELYVQTTLTTALIGGPNIVSKSALRLENPRTINGVEFDGTNNITISSTLTNSLIFGDYVAGATSFNGSVTTTLSVDVGTVTEATPDKVVARNANGDIWFRIGHGTATAARYADLAEKYLADRDYDVGTVVTIGGSAEITQCNYGDRAIGVISGNPGFMMNESLENGTYVALKGRVPVKISGTVKKSQRLIAGPEGRAVAILGANPDVFAVALEDSNGKDIVEALIL